MTSDAIIEKWNNFFTRKGINQTLHDKYIEYIKILVKNNVPIIFDFNHLRLLMGRSDLYFTSVINSPENHYRSFKLKKRNGGFREILAPYPALLEMQYWIYNNILKKIPISPYSHGFAHKKSIITNAKIHLGQKELLKLDLKDFFPSIKINRIIYVFKSLGYTNQVAFYLASLCSYNETLPQGAPTSPYLSNIIAKKLDKRLIRLSKKYKLHYTRYADDLTFSGDSIPAKLIEYINNIVNSEGFTLNSEKTRLYKHGGKRIVTGISVNGKELKLPKDYKRNLRQELYFIMKYGYESHIKKKKIRKVNYLNILLGKVNFWLSVEPSNKFALDAHSFLLETYKKHNK
ncbi:rNA-directed DNA polymerase [Prevotella sp. CAG:1185]|nr:rNA-directed DNA polymerase [Prevotella sp. CAG:1185]